MAVNAFEGARRISLVIGALWVLGWGSFALFAEPSYWVNYRILWPGAEPVLMTVTECEDEEGRESILDYKTATGSKFNVGLCFVAIKSRDGQKIGIPYKVEPSGDWMANTRYSPEVSEYQKRAASRFQIPPKTIPDVNARKRAAYIDHWKFAAQFLFGGLLAGWAFVAVVGWIVRGFMGVPRGADRRPIS